MGGRDVWQAGGANGRVVDARCGGYAVLAPPLPLSRPHHLQSLRRSPWFTCTPARDSHLPALTPPLPHALLYQDPEALPLLGFTSTKPIIPMPTTLANAARLAYLLRRPAAAELTDKLWDFTADSSIYVHSFPALIGKTVMGACAGGRGGKGA